MTTHPPAASRRHTAVLQLLLLAAALLLVGWTLAQVPLDAMWRALRRLNPLEIAALVAVNGGALALLSGRWWLLLRALGHPVGYATLAGYRLVAFAVSYFTPGTHFGGEPVQVYLTQARHQVPLSRAVAAVTVDRLLDLLANFTFLLFGMAVSVALPGVLTALPARLVWVALALALLPALLLWLLARGARPLSATARRLLPRRRLAAALRLGTVEAAIGEIGPRAMWQAVLWSLLTWATLIAEYWLALRFLGVPLSPLQAIAALTAMRVAYFVPTPGALGALEASQVLALQALGYDPAVGMALALIIRARDITVGLGGLAWGRRLQVAGRRQ